MKEEQRLNFPFCREISLDIEKGSVGEEVTHSEASRAMKDRSIGVADPKSSHPQS
jgi:hypothetical protein